MNLIGTSYSNMAIAILCVSLALLVLIIAYRKLLAYLGKGRVPTEKYCVLYRIEKNPVQGMVEFYFTSEEERFVHFELLNEDYTVFKELSAEDRKVGGHIIHFDSTSIPNGVYYYQLRTENQKTMKKMVVEN